VDSAYAIVALVIGLCVVAWVAMFLVDATREIRHQRRERRERSEL
jgi:multisubunit Na+/H+ antiporter MnhC subunit